MEQREYVRNMFLAYKRKGLGWRGIFVNSSGTQVRWNTQRLGAYSVFQSVTFKASRPPASLCGNAFHDLQLFPTSSLFTRHLGEPVDQPERHMRAHAEIYMKRQSPADPFFHPPPPE